MQPGYKMSIREAAACGADCARLSRSHCGGVAAVGCRRGERSLATIAIPMKTDADESRHSPDAKDTHCAFSSLAQPLLGGIPPVLLAIALAAIILLGLAPLGRLPVAPIPYLRPPLRGPPASI